MESVILSGAVDIWVFGCCHYLFIFEFRFKKKKIL